MKKPTKAVLKEVLKSDPIKLKRMWKAAPKVAERINREHDVENGCYDQEEATLSTHSFPDYNTERRQEWIRDKQCGRKDWEYLIVGLSLVAIILVVLAR